MKVALISCSSRKRNVPCIASEMYAPSPLFSQSYEYAKQFADRIFILSAKYGLLEEDTHIEPYNLNLANVSSKERQRWAQNVSHQLKEKCDMQNDEFLILAGAKYYENLLPALTKNSIPLEHVSLGSRTNALKELIQVCDELHDIFNGERRYTSSEIESIPFDNGIYIVFEKNEKYKDWQRIVRVGTHDAQARLRERLRDHFLRKNKDGSIFRKNLGKAILKRQDDPYLAIWTLDTSKPENRENMDRKLQSSVELEVSAYLEENMSFAVFPVKDVQQRLRIEKAIISSLSHTDAFGPNKNWLGNNSPEQEIRDSGLWLKRGLNEFSLTYDELCFIRRATDGQEDIPPIASQIKSIQSSALKSNYKSNRSDHQESARTPGTTEIREYILATFAQFRARGEDSCTLVSGDIHRAMGLKNTMPSVCSVMYQLKRTGDQILNTTPSGKSSTIKIKYHLS